MKPENQTVNRLVGLDIVRTVAVICVICGHFFSINTPYNQTPYEGSSMYFQGFLKSVFCSVGVPFFLLLSGFLCCHKSLSISYYKSIRKVLVPYLVISIIAWIVLSSSYSLHKMILGILGFKIIGYAWYVEMYLGLFLIIPFINIVLEEVFKKGWTWYLLATALLMTALPALVNRKGITLVPGFWTMTFPVTYYVIGALIRHFEPHWKNKWLAFLGSLLLFAIGPFSRAIIFKVSGGGISASVSGSYYSLINVFATSILFILLYDINNLPRWKAKTFEFCALAAFETFLFSYLFDKLLYPIFLEKCYTSQSQFIVWFVPITLLVFVFSLSASYLYKGTILLFDKTISYVKNRNIR